MNDNLQRQLAEFLKFLLTQAQDATTWAKTQVPPLVEEKIRFGRVWHSVVVVLCAAAMWLLMKFAKWCWTKLDDNDDWGAASAAAVIGCIVLATVAYDNFHDAVLAWTAPRLYIVQWLIEMVKANK